MGVLSLWRQALSGWSSMALDQRQRADVSSYCPDSGAAQQHPGAWTASIGGGRLALGAKMPRPLVWSPTQELPEAQPQRRLNVGERQHGSGKSLGG